MAAYVETITSSPDDRVWKCRAKCSHAWNKRMVSTQVSDNFTELHKPHV